MSENYNNYNFNADEDIVLMTAIIMSGVALMLLIWKNPDNPIINTSLTALVMYGVSAGTKSIKLNK